MINFDQRLKKLKDRRQGTRERAILESYGNEISRSVALNSSADVRSAENYETLKEAAGVKYAVGAMAPVSSKSTQISIREGERVSDNLISGLKAQGIYTGRRLQGSVALDIHIEGHSDVDMLIILDNPVLTEKPYVDPTRYSPATDPRPVVDIVRELRLTSERVLPQKYPAATVDASGNKSISIEGGSLSRKVDIVPASWYDTIEYQSSNSETGRGVDVYHKGDHSLNRNYPFKHIKVVNDRDALYSGNLKCVVRLLKNIVADMPDYKKTVVKRLSSYDLTAIAYHMNQQLNIPEYMRLSLVEHTRSHLELLQGAEAYRNALDVPDGTRKIFNEAGKTDALEILSKETADLAYSIFKELQPYSTAYDSSVVLNKSIFNRVL